jgi:hypothetical protein
MPKFAVTVNDNGVRKRVVLDSATEPTEADVLSALRGSAAEPSPQPPATIAEMRRREEQGMVAALPEAQAAVAVGSTAQLNKAVQDAGNVGKMESFVGTMGQMAEPTGMLAPFEGGRLQPSGEFTRGGAAESRGMRRGAALGAAMIPPLLAAPAAAGMGLGTGLLFESGVGLGSQALSQTISPEPYRFGEMMAGAVPGVPVGQRASKLAQFALETGSSVGTAAAQAGLEAAFDEGTDLSDVLLSTGLAGILTPSASIGFRTAGALGRARGVQAEELVGPLNSVGKFERAKRYARQAAAEFERPFTQQFIQDRKQEVLREFDRQGAGGLAAQSADEIARLLYSPNSGLRPDEFRKNISDIVSKSLARGVSSGLPADEISSSIKTQLGNYVQNADKISADAVDRFVDQSETLLDRVQNAVDSRLATRNKRLTDLARIYEGRYSTDSQPLIDQITGLKAKRDSLPSGSAERTRIDGEISQINQRIQDIEAGALPGYGPAAGISREELGQQVQQVAREELEAFKKQSKEGYGKLEPKLDEVKITTTEIGPDGKEVEVVKTANQLREERSKILKEIDFNKAVQKADYSVFERLDKINNQLNEALADSPNLKNLLEAENKFYSTGISRFKGFFADKVLREAGEAGGMPGIVSTISGANGAQNLRLLKNMLGNRYGEIEPNLRAFVYTQIKGENPNQFLDSLAKGKGGYATGIQKEVVNELFPDLSEINDVATKYRSLIGQRAALEVEKKSIDSNIKELQNQVDSGIAGAQEKLNQLTSRTDVITDKISKLRASNVIERENRIIESLGKIQARVNEAGAARGDALDTFKLDEVVRELATEEGVPLYKALERAVESTSAARDKFYDVVKKAMQPGGQLENFTPSNLIDFLAPAKGSGLSSDYRVKRFMEVVGKNKPELINDAQNMLIGRIISESFDGSKIDTKKISSLVGNKEAQGKYYEATQRLLGEDGVKRINTVANQLEQVSDLGKPSVFSRFIAPALATGVGYGIGYGTYKGLVGAGVGLGGYGVYKTMEKGMKEAVDAAIGRILKTPEYLDIVSKPLDSATKAQIDKIERLWPRILNIERDRLMLNQEEAEPVLTPFKQSLSNLFGR